MKIVLLFFFSSFFLRIEVKYHYYFASETSPCHQNICGIATHTHTKVFRCSIIKIRKVYTKETQPTVYNTATVFQYIHIQ